MSADEATRVRRSANLTTSPEVLRELASDPSVTVRASLALHPALPPQVSEMLANDIDARVRAILSRKLATLTPGLTEPDQRRLQSDAIATLTALVAEAGLRVRASIAATVRDMPDGPREIILRLAHDPAVMVSEPVILFSPMLTSDDLVSLIASGPPPSTIYAVARRPEIDTDVSDAVVGSSDVAAIGALLKNRTAQIREATLDALAAQSEDHPDWHEPMVRRPSLPPRAARVLSEIVRGHLLETLAAREDLDPKLRRELRTMLAPQVGHSGRPGAGLGDMTPAVALEHATALQAAGQLDDAAIGAALRESATVLATAMLAVKTDVPVAVIERASGLRSAKAIVSLAWKAGFSMQTAVLLQALLARLSPDAVVRAAAGGGYPLPFEEMRWQLGFLGIKEHSHRVWKPRRLGGPEA